MSEQVKDQIKSTTEDESELEAPLQDVEVEEKKSETPKLEAE